MQCICAAAVEERKLVVTTLPVDSLSIAVLWSRRDVMDRILKHPWRVFIVVVICLILVISTTLLVGDISCLPMLLGTTSGVMLNTKRTCYHILLVLVKGYIRARVFSREIEGSPTLVYRNTMGHVPFSSY